MMNEENKQEMSQEENAADKSAQNAPNAAEDAEMTPAAAALYPKVLEIIEDIRGSLQADGGDIELLTITPELKAKVRLVGACSGCPHAALTLRYGVERFLCENIPELNGLESVDPIPGLDDWGDLDPWGEDAAESPSPAPSPADEQ